MGRLRFPQRRFVVFKKNQKKTTTIAQPARQIFTNTIALSGGSMFARFCAWALDNSHRMRLRKPSSQCNANTPYDECNKTQDHAYILLKEKEPTSHGELFFLSGTGENSATAAHKRQFAQCLLRRIHLTFDVFYQDRTFVIAESCQNILDIRFTSIDE
jgi:hypothetical protein